MVREFKDTAIFDVFYLWTLYYGCDCNPIFSIESNLTHKTCEFQLHGSNKRGFHAIIYLQSMLRTNTSNHKKGTGMQWASPLQIKKEMNWIISP